MRTSKLFRVATMVLLTMLAFVVGGYAAEWKPSKPIEFIVPFAPGGGSDVLARSIASIVEAEKICPVPLIVINRPGGGGMIGTASAAKERGNPHILLTYVSGQVPAALVVGKGAPTYREVTLIAGLALDEQLIVVKTESPFKTVHDIVAEVKRRPGVLTVGGTAPGQDDQICQVLFERAAGIKLRYVPFASGGECITALLGGHVDMIWANPPEFAPQYEAKMVRPVAVAKTTRMSELPDVPTFREAGYDVTYFFFRGIAAAPDIPPEVVTFYEKMMKRMVESSAWKERYLKKFMLSPGWMGREEFTRSVAKLEESFKEILIELGLIK